MCGIAGFWDFKARLSEEKARDALKSMTDTMIARGPDGADYHYDPKNAIGFGHRRLSIVDLSDAGRQPMESANSRYVITYNGELYNTEDLRADLIASGKKQFRGHSDTEVLIEYVDSFGIEKTLQNINGMFAFVIYDRHEDQIMMARDQAGVKPLYWSLRDDLFIFGSELKSFIDHPLFKAEFNENCVADFLSFNTIPVPQTIFKDCYKLQPAHYAILKRGEEPKIQRYWSVPKIDPAAEIDFELLLKDAVKRQMVSDVPLGVFLSGGIDSSLITALMQSQSNKPIKTFTIGFEEVTHDESVYARQVAECLGTEHTEERLSVQKAQDIISNLPNYYDEPFADSSQLPSLLLSQMARKYVTVCLSGDGGDELFAGYDRYFYGRKIMNLMDLVGKMPLSGSILNMLSKCGLDHVPFGPDNLSMKVQKMGEMAKQRGFPSHYKTLIDLWTDNPAHEAGQFEFHDAVDADSMTAMRFADMQCYLPDDILHKMDRASMTHSLEVRVPFLDYRVVEAAFQTPIDRHVAGNKGKIILRNILKKYVPEHLFERPKSGFSVPIADWLRGDLRGLVEHNFATLDDTIFDASIIQKRWQQHVQGSHNWQHSLWGVLMLQMWRDHYKI